jgi:hypothetical protein
MTESLQRAFDAASHLPADEQDAIAAWIITELESDRQWNTFWDRSQDELATLAGEALEEHTRGESQDLDLS